MRLVVMMVMVTSCSGKGDGDGQGPEAGPRHQAGAGVQEEHHLPGQGSCVTAWGHNHNHGLCLEQEQQVQQPASQPGRDSSQQGRLSCRGEKRSLSVLFTLDTHECNKSIYSLYQSNYYPPSG